MAEFKVRQYPCGAMEAGIGRVSSHKRQCERCQQIDKAPARKRKKGSPQ